MLRILIHSNSPWAPTGYGQQTALIAPRLVALGHEVAVSAFYGLMGKPSTWEGIPIFPGGLDGYGNDLLWGHAGYFRADLVIILVDSWVMNVPPEWGHKTVNLMPVDCWPLGAMDEEKIRASGATIFAISKFGHQMLEEAGFTPEYVPHGIDTKAFFPARNKLEILDELQIPPGTFVIGMNAANKDAVRKGFPEQILAFAEFHERHPDSLLMIHAMIQAPGALNLHEIINRSGYKNLLEAVRFTDQYALLSGLVQPKNLAAWYSAIDVLSSCSFGEGFGLPILEAQACGTPVVTTNWTAMPEITGSGWTVNGEKFWNGAHKSWWIKPKIAEITRAYEKAYQARENDSMELYAKRARKFALKYEVDKIMEDHWVPALAKAEQRVREHDEAAKVAEEMPEAVAAGE